jgi:chromosome segregation ATPase
MMSALFVALGIMVLALLVLLLWFVPHLLQQQAVHVASETEQLREMLLDLLNEQESVAVRQAQLGSSLSNLQAQLEHMSLGTPVPGQAAYNPEQLDRRIADLQRQISDWLDGRQQGERARTQQDNESWAYLMSLLAAIQERVGSLSQERAGAAAGARATALLEDLEQEMNHLRSISEDISRLQQRLRHSLSEHEHSMTGLRTRAMPGPVDGMRVGGA